MTKDFKKHNLNCFKSSKVCNKVNLLYTSKKIQKSDTFRINLVFRHTANFVWILKLLPVDSPPDPHSSKFLIKNCYFAFLQFDRNNSGALHQVLLIF